jgi:hypothetical protein
LLNTRAAEPGNPAEAIADYVQAQRVRKEVLQICEQWLATHAASPASENPESEQEQKKGAAERYWVMASQGEAYLGLGLPEKADSVLQQAYALAPETWMKTSTEEQLAKLRGLLATNPLRFIAAESNL